MHKKSKDDVDKEVAD